MSLFRLRQLEKEQLFEYIVEHSPIVKKENESDCSVFGIQFANSVYIAGDMTPCDIPINTLNVMGTKESKFVLYGVPS